MCSSTVQNPIRLPDESEPQPDLALLTFGRYTRVLPSPSDVLVVIEVSDTTRVYDRETKFPIYAAAGIPEAWLVDLGGNRIERHTEPGADGYPSDCPLRMRRNRRISYYSLGLPSLSMGFWAIDIGSDTC